jgi:hypothetical protein
MRQIIEDSVFLNIKINYLTFNLYQNLDFPNAIYLSSFRSMKQITKLIYMPDN